MSPASMVPTTHEESPGAPAPPRENPWREHPLVLEAQGGLSSPLGFLGVALDLSLGERFAINAGIGAGRGAEESSLGERLQYAVSARLRWPLTAPLDPLQLALGPEVGLSEGSFTSSLNCLFVGGPCDPSAWSHVLWTNANAVFEMRQGPFQIRAFAGAAVPLVSKATDNCVSYPGGGSACIPAPSGNPPVGVNLGGAVGLTLF